jgi:glycosyltransferase involved in cell wall biosynthesis
VKVCLDAQAAVAQRAGVGRYVRELARRLPALRGGDELLLVHFDFRGRAAEAPAPGVERRVVRAVPRRLVQAGWSRLRFPPFDLFSGPADVFHFPNFVVPPLRRGRSVVTVHDLSFLRFPETAEPRNLAYLRKHVAAGARGADAVIAVSRFVAEELGDALGLPAEKVHAVPQGVDERFRPASAGAVAAAKRRLRLDAPYLLHVGTVEPRKNLAFLVDVLERLEGFDGDLVLAGMLGWRYEPILQRIRSSPRADRIRRLSHVPDEDLPALYSGAEALVFPSLYEGFGLPPLEAMACGTPVVVSDGGSLPEVVGDAGEVVSGFRADEWAARVREVLGRGKAAGRGRRMERAAGFRWEETARRTWEVYRLAGR